MSRILNGIRLSDEQSAFIKHVQKMCKKHRIELILSPSKRVVDMQNMDSECSGYFDSSYKVMVVACGKPFIEWLAILSHEFCHMVQWIEEKKKWNKSLASYDKFWDWLSGSMKMSEEELESVLDVIIDLETDCDMKSVELIKEWNLSIPIGDYIRKSNAYAFSYRLMPTYKVFPTGVYYDKDVVSASPSKFLKSYKKVPEKLSAELHRFYATIKK